MRDTALTHFSASNRVLHVTTLSKINCGASVSLIETVKALRGYVDQSVFVVTEGETSTEIRKLGVDVLTALDTPLEKRAFKGKGTLLSIKGFYKALKKAEPDLIHLLSAESLKCLGWASLLSGIPVIAHQRETYRGGWRVAGLKYSKKIVAISNYVQSTLPQEIQDKSEVVYNPVTLPEHTEGSPSPKDKLRILYIGRYHFDKGPDLLLSSFGKLDSSIDAELELLGSNNSSTDIGCEQHLQKILSEFPYEKQEKVFFIPWQRNVSDFINTADIVVIPSRVKEGLGRVALEAMAHGTPVIAANHGGLKEIIEHGETGLLFRPNDAEALASQISILLQSADLRYQLAVKGRAEIKNRFSEEAFRNSLLRVYNNCYASETES